MPLKRGFLTVEAVRVFDVVEGVGVDVRDLPDIEAV